MNYSKIRKIIVIAFFAIIGLLADRVSVAALWGAKGQTFTLLQLFAPAVGAFLGGVGGIVTVALTEVASFLIQGKDVTLMNVVRLLPLLFATLYFAAVTRAKTSTSESHSDNSINAFPKEPKFVPIPASSGGMWKFIEIGVPALAMIVFWAHPIGRQAWYFPLYWTIPMIVALTPLKKFLLAQSFGATFTAHAVGGASWIWMTNMAAPLWTALIPVVAIERSAFAIGIAVTYMAVNSLLAALPVLQTLPIFFNAKYRFFSRASRPV